MPGCYEAGGLGTFFEVEEVGELAREAVFVPAFIGERVDGVRDEVGKEKKGVDTGVNSFTGSERR